MIEEKQKENRSIDILKFMYAIVVVSIHTRPIDSESAIYSV